MNTISITKLEAARRQMETAIKLWFEDEDSVSVHTLASAALGILNDLGKPVGETAMRFNQQSFRKETFAELVKLLKVSQNFFKHADNDPDAVLDFRPEGNKYLLVDCVDTYHRLAKGPTPVMIVYWNHFVIHHPQYFTPIVTSDPIDDLRRLSKADFFCYHLAAVTKYHT